MNFDPEKVLNDEEVLELIRQVTSMGNVDFGSHVREQMKFRGYTLRDVLHILCHGCILKREFDNARRNWKYTIAGDDLEGEKGVVITAVLSHHRIFLVTVLGGMNNGK